MQALLYLHECECSLYGLIKQEGKTRLIWSSIEFIPLPLIHKYFLTKQYNRIKNQRISAAVRQFTLTRQASKVISSTLTG